MKSFLSKRSKYITNQSILNNEYNVLNTVLFCLVLCITTVRLRIWHIFDLILIKPQLEAFILSYIDQHRSPGGVIRSPWIWNRLYNNMRWWYQLFNARYSLNWQHAYSIFSFSDPSRHLITNDKLLSYRCQLMVIYPIIICRIVELKLYLSVIDHKYRCNESIFFLFYFLFLLSIPISLLE